MGDGPVEAVLADLATAPIPEPLKKTLAFLKKVTQAHDQVTAADVKVLLDAGVSKQQVKDALNVAWCFNVITRLADTFQFEVGPRAAFDVGAKMLLTRGYR
jgi:alkylhydroperoxidase family enzyme